MGAGGAGATGTGAGGTGTGRGGDASLGGWGAGASAGAGRGAGLGTCTVSGSCVVVFNGTLDSGTLENTDRLSVERSATWGRGVMARLASAPGLIACTYCTTT